MIAAVLRFAAVLATIVAAYWALLFFAQRRMMFPAPPTVGAPPRPPDAAQVWLASTHGATEAWFLPPAAGPQPAPVLIFGHGNGELIDYWPAEFTPVRGWGVGVLLVEYPGYGRSAGAPSEASIREAFLAAYDWAVAQPMIDSTRIIGYGRSLGGGAIGLLSRERHLAAMIMESAFTSTRFFARAYAAPGFLVRDPFDNLAAVGAFDGPLLVLHGERDDIIPAAHGRALAEAGGVTLETMPCGHNDCARPWGSVRVFLERSGLQDSP